MRLAKGVKVLPVAYRTFKTKSTEVTVLVATFVTSFREVGLVRSCCQTYWNFVEAMCTYSSVSVVHFGSTADIQ